MPITLTQMQSIAKELEPFIINQKIEGIEELSPGTFILALFSARVLISLKDPFLRFHLSQRKGGISSSSFLRKLKENIVENILVKMEILNEDRILELSFIAKNKEKQTLVIEFFPRRPNAFLLNNNREIIDTFHPVEATHYTLPPKPLPPHHLQEPLLSSAEMEELYEEKERDAHFLARKNVLVQLSIKNYKKSIKRREERVEQLQNCLEWKVLQYEGILLQSNLFRIKRGMEEVIVEDWENEGKLTILTLDPKLPPHECIKERFKKSKKLKDGIPHLQRLVEKAESEEAEWKIYAETIKSLSTPQELEQFLKKNKAFEAPTKREPRQKTPEALTLPYREFLSASGLKIWVGKNAEGNEELTFRHAHGNDWWLHVSGYAGSHIVIKTDHGKDPDEEAVLDAVQLAIAYSKGKGKGRVQVTVTQRKFVTRAPRGRKGQVQVSKHKERNAVGDQERLHAIKARKVIPLL